MQRDVGDLAKATPTVAVPKSRNEREAQSKSGGSGTTQPVAGLPASQVPAATQSSRVGCSSGVKQVSTTNNGSDESEEKEKTKRYKIGNFNPKMYDKIIKQEKANSAGSGSKDSPEPVDNLERMIEALGTNKQPVERHRSLTDNIGSKRQRNESFCQ